MTPQQGVDADASVERINYEADLSAAGVDADSVQECTPERLAFKQEVFRALDDAARPDAILASGASVLQPDDVFARIPGWTAPLPSPSGASDEPTPRRSAG